MKSQIGSHDEVSGPGTPDQNRSLEAGNDIRHDTRQPACRHLWTVPSVVAVTRLRIFRWSGPVVDFFDSSEPFGGGSPDCVDSVMTHSRYAFIASLALLATACSDDGQPAPAGMGTTGNTASSQASTADSTTVTSGTGVTASSSSSNTTSGVTASTSSAVTTSGTSTTTGGMATGSSNSAGGASSTSDGTVGTTTGTTGSTAAGGTGGDGTTTSSTTGSPLPPTDDYSADGPFSTTVDANTGPGGNYTVYRPDPLGEDGFLHAPIIFGPGINMQVSAMAGLLTSFATHGFVVVGCNLLTGPPNDAGNRQAMLDGLDWIVAQNDEPGIYQGKLDVTHAVSMGYSVGGTAAVEVGAHEAVATTVSIHGHIATSALHGPMLQTSGTQDTVGLPMQQETFDNSEVQTFLGTVTNADHGYIQADNGGVQRPAIIAWMRYWIYNDTGAAHYFYGDDCVMCTAPWENPQRKNWQ